MCRGPGLGCPCAHGVCLHPDQCTPIHLDPIDLEHTHTHRTAQGEEHVDILPQDGADTSGANKTRITTRFLTKYERARILGTRALQIRCAAGWLGCRGGVVL